MYIEGLTLTHICTLDGFHMVRYSIKIKDKWEPCYEQIKRTQIHLTGKYTKQELKRLMSDANSLWLHANLRVGLVSYGYGLERVTWYTNNMKRNLWWKKLKKKWYNAKRKRYDVVPISSPTSEEIFVLDHENRSFLAPPWLGV